VIEFDEFGLMKSISARSATLRHRLIEEFMLSANECVAEYLESRRIASFISNHEKPDAKRVYDFEVIAGDLWIFRSGVGRAHSSAFQFKSDRRRQRATGKQAARSRSERCSQSRRACIRKLAAKIAGKPEERILSYLMLRSLTAGALFGRRTPGTFRRLAAPDLYALYVADSKVSGFDCASDSEGGLREVERHDGEIPWVLPVAVSTPVEERRSAPRQVSP